jgi:hypothetical protein
VYRPYQDTDAVAEHLAKNLVDLPHFVVRAHGLTGFALYNGENGLTARALVVALHDLCMGVIVQKS